MPEGRRRFRIRDEIAEGGFGKVFLAEVEGQDGRFERLVAIKLLHARWKANDDVVARTRDEARLLALVRHQNIVRVEDLLTIDGKVAVVMEYLEGVDLRWMIQFLARAGRLFPRRALLEIAADVASALHAAYSAPSPEGGAPLQVIHRDIKPSNLFVTTAGDVKVLDFGTARATFARREAITYTQAFGSEGYMSPERLRGQRGSPASDVFALGVSLWELLTFASFGVLPPVPAEYTQELERRLDTVLLRGDPAWAGALRGVLRQMLAWDPDHRPSPADLVGTFRDLAAGATDMALARFGTAVVAKARAALPRPADADPLIGAVVEEDRAGGPQVPVVPGALRRSVSPRAPRLPEAPPAPSPAEDFLRRLLITTALLGLGVIGAVLGLAVLGIGAISLGWLEPLRSPVPTALSYSDPRGAELVLEGPEGFATTGRVEGTAPWELEGLVPGVYRAQITDADGRSWAGVPFEVVAGRAACRYTFLVQDGQWVGECT